MHFAQPTSTGPPHRTPGVTMILDDDGVGAQQRYVSLYTDLLQTVRELGLLRRRQGYYLTRMHTNSTRRGC